MTKEELTQWAEDVSKAYDILAFGHTERAAEILAKTRNSMRKVLAQPEQTEKLEALFTNIDHAISCGAWGVQRGSLTWEIIAEAKASHGIKENT